MITITIHPWILLVLSILIFISICFEIRRVFLEIKFKKARLKEVKGKFKTSKIDGD